MNKPNIEAIEKLKKLSERVLNADTISRLVLQATGDQEQADEVYTQLKNLRKETDKTGIPSELFSFMGGIM